MVCAVTELAPDDPVAARVAEVIRSGDVAGLTELLAVTPTLAASRIVGSANGVVEARSLLHVLTDWPGRVRHGAAIVRLLVDAGADVDARFAGSHRETPLHWAASSDDVEIIDALIAAGADIEADGAVIAGGTALDDAVAFAQWQAARRLVELGAQPALWHAAALGRIADVVGHFEGRPLAGRYPWGAEATPPPRDLDVAFWCACHGGQLTAAAYLLGRGADRHWVAPWDGTTPLSTATRSGAMDVVDFLGSLER